MWTLLALPLLVLTVVPVNPVSGELRIRPMAGRSFESSFSSSVSWSDGQLHPQLREMREETMSDDSGVHRMRSVKDCKDGLCQESTEHLVPMAALVPEFGTAGFRGIQQLIEQEMSEEAGEDMQGAVADNVELEERAPAEPVQAILQGLGMTGTLLEGLAGRHQIHATAIRCENGECDEELEERAPAEPGQAILQGLGMTGTLLEGLAGRHQIHATAIRCENGECEMVAMPGEAERLPQRVELAVEANEAKPKAAGEEVAKAAEAPLPENGPIKAVAAPTATSETVLTDSSAGAEVEVAGEGEAAYHVTEV